MPNPKRQWYPGAIYHVISRGIRRTPIYLNTADFNKFINILDNTYHYTPFSIHAYCLMTNHYHLLLGTKGDPLHKIMHSINSSYATWFNKKYNLTGHVFESRYTSHPVPSDYGLMTVSAYIHNNPRAANIVSDPIDYPYSSFPFYAYPEIVAEPPSLTTTSLENRTIGTNQLYHLHPNTANWNLFQETETEFPTRSPPIAFTRDRLNQLFPTPLHCHYSRYVDREWTLSNL